MKIGGKNMREMLRYHQKHDPVKGSDNARNILSKSEQRLIRSQIVKGRKEVKKTRKRHVYYLRVSANI